MNCRGKSIGLLKPCVVVAVLLLPNAGCGRRQTQVSDRGQAKQVLVAVLENWKAGASVDEQRELKPPIYVAEELWQNGSQLEDYQLDGEGELTGTNVRFHVTLVLPDEKRPASNRKVRYLVTTTPAHTVAREDR